MTALRWVFADGRAHVLTHRADDHTLVTACTLTLPATTPVYSVAPSLDVCRSCERPTVLDVPPPEFSATPTVF